MKEVCGVCTFIRKDFGKENVITAFIYALIARVLKTKATYILFVFHSKEACDILFVITD